MLLPSAFSDLADVLAQVGKADMAARVAGQALAMARVLGRSMFFEVLERRLSVLESTRYRKDLWAISSGLLHAERWWTA